MARHAVHWLCVLLLLGMASTARSQLAEVVKLLDDISATYETIEGVDVNLALEEDPAYWEEIVIAEDGRLASRQIERRSEQLAHIRLMYVDGEHVYLDVPAGYTKTPLASLPELRIWWASQLSAPWPMVANWIRTIRAADDAEIHVRGEKLLIGSPSLMLRLQFDRNNFALEQLDTYSSSTYVFADFDWTVAPPMPLTRDLVVELSNSDSSTRVVNSRMFYAEREFNPDDLEDRLRFDPVALDVNRYDPSTGNVLDENGNVDYNYDKYVKSVIEKAEQDTDGSTQPSGKSGVSWLVWVGVGGLFLAGFVLVRRHQN